MLLVGLLGVALLGVDVLEQLLAVAAGGLGRLGRQVEAVAHQLGEARPGRVEHLPLAGLQVLQQLAQLRHALDRLRLVVVAQRFQQVLLQLGRPAADAGAEAAAELRQQFVDLLPAPRRCRPASAGAAAARPR